MTYCKGPYQHFTSLPSPSTTVLHSSREIDFVERRYTTDTNGNPEGMPSTRQRVFLALDFGTGSPPAFQTEPELARRRAAIIAALQPMVVEGAIRLESVDVVAGSTGTTQEQVSYTDLGTGDSDTVTRWP